MSILGILACEILEFEFVHLLDTDKEIERITVLEDARSARLIKKFDSAGVENLTLIAALNKFRLALMAVLKSWFKFLSWLYIAENIKELPFSSLDSKNGKVAVS